MLEAHPLASMFPLIEGPAFDELVASVKAYGLINPIIMLDGKILDGRNRYRACLTAGVEPHFVNNEEVDPAKWRALVDALNVQRRHLNESQRALLAAELRRSGDNVNDAAQKMGIGVRSLEKASAVLQSGSAEIIDLVSRGRTTVHRAEQVIKGKLPVTDLLSKRGGGRPRGNVHVVRFEKVMDDVAMLALHKDAIINHWKGDPFTTKKLREAIDFFQTVEVNTREADRADTVA